jgi:hypothetical protein
MILELECGIKIYVLKCVNRTISVRMFFAVNRLKSEVQEVIV